MSKISNKNTQTVLCQRRAGISIGPSEFLIVSFETRSMRSRADSIDLNWPLWSETWAPPAEGPSLRDGFLPRTGYMTHPQDHKPFYCGAGATSIRDGLRVTFRLGTRRTDLQSRG